MTAVVQCRSREGGSPIIAAFRTPPMRGVSDDGACAALGSAVSAVSNAATVASILVVMAPPHERRAYGIVAVGAEACPRRLAAAGPRGTLRPMRRHDGYGAVIFDLDGVLVDSEGIGFVTLQAHLRTYGVDYRLEDNAPFI